MAGRPGENILTGANMKYLQTAFCPVPRPRLRTGERDKGGMSDRCGYGVHISIYIFLLKGVYQITAIYGDQPRLSWTPVVPGARENRGLTSVHPEMLKMQNGSQSPPLKKRDLGGFPDSYKIPPIPPLVKGGILYRVRFVGAGLKPAPTSDINKLSG
jgi:hypothetical protein